LVRVQVEFIFFQIHYPDLDYILQTKSEYG
jgi:hypothetical protein